MTFTLKQKKQDDEETLAKAVFRHGMSLYGYCCGIFGRDSYGEKIIQSVAGNVIVATENGVIIAGTLHPGIHTWKQLIESSNQSLKEIEEGEIHAG